MLVPFRMSRTQMIQEHGACAAEQATGDRQPLGPCLPAEHGGHLLADDFDASVAGRHDRSMIRESVGGLGPQCPVPGPRIPDPGMPTREAVLDFYAKGGRQNPYLDPALRPVSFSATERGALVAFLRALSGDVK